MVRLDELQLEVYTNTLAVAYATKGNTSVSSEFYFPFGKAMCFVKELADSCNTLSDLGQKVLNKAVEIAYGRSEL